MRRYLVVAAVLLLINWLVAGALYGGPARPTIAYSPLFLDQGAAYRAAGLEPPTRPGGRDPLPVAA